MVNEQKIFITIHIWTFKKIVWLQKNYKLEKKKKKK